jgi:hypothetical protein
MLCCLFDFGISLTLTCLSVFRLFNEANHDSKFLPYRKKRFQQTLIAAAN